MPSQGGSIRLFKVAGIEVFLHWSWFLIAIYEVQVWRSIFSSPLWAALLYVGLFVLVTMHEFGHALACRQVGGRADRIVRWPLGGIAFVSPPPRAGAMLWSIAAGPMVNLLLAPILFYVAWAASRRRVDTNRFLSRFPFGPGGSTLGVFFFPPAPFSPPRQDACRLLRSGCLSVGLIKLFFVAGGGVVVGGGLVVFFPFWQSSWLGRMVVFFLLSGAVRRVSGGVVAEKRGRSRSRSAGRLAPPGEKSGLVLIFCLGREGLKFKSSQRSAWLQSTLSTPTPTVL